MIGGVIGNRDVWVPRPSEVIVGDIEEARDGVVDDLLAAETAVTLKDIGDGVDQHTGDTGCRRSSVTRGSANAIESSHRQRLEHVGPSRTAPPR